MKPLIYSHGIGVKHHHECAEQNCIVEMKLGAWLAAHEGSKYWLVSVARVNGAPLSPSRYVDVVALSPEQAAPAILSGLRSVDHLPEVEALPDGIHTVTMVFAGQENPETVEVVDMEIVIVGKGALDTFGESLPN